MNDNFWNEVRAAQELASGLAAALRGEYVTGAAEADPLIARIRRVCEEVQREYPQRHMAKSLINPSPSRSVEINIRKIALAKEFDALLHELTAPASLVADVLNVYDPSRHNATRGFLDTPSLAPSVAEVRTLQQAVTDHQRPEFSVPAGSPVAEHLQSWSQLRAHLQELYADLDGLSASETFVLNQANAEVVDSLLADEAPESSWDGEALTEVLTLHDLRTGEVLIHGLTGVHVEGANWIVRFADTAQLPLLGKGEVLRLVTVDGTLANDVPHQDLEFQDGMLLVVGVETEYLELLRRLSVHDVQQLALLHYGYRA